MTTYTPGGTSPPGWANRMPYQANGNQPGAYHSGRDQYQQSPTASFDSYPSAYPNGSSQPGLSQTTAPTNAQSPSETAPASDARSAPGAPSPMVYLATYSNVPVYEITVRGIAVMRRRLDGYLNATQILKVAGVEKARRTKILEKEILTGEHEKVQGGYGKYQGTW